MDFSKAIRMLGLANNFTKEELNKAYSELIEKCHINSRATGEKENNNVENEIIAAKEYLERYLKKNSKKRNTYKTNEEINLKLKIDKLKMLLNNTKLELIVVPGIVNDELIEKTKNKIKKLINETATTLQFVSSLEEFKNLENYYYTKTAHILKIFEQNYCKKYNIKLENLKLERYSLKILCELLEQTKKEQNGFSIDELLNKEHKKYYFYKEYPIIRKHICNIQEDIVNKNYDVRDTNENIINEFTKRVLEAFKDYFIRLEKLNNFKLLNIKKAKFKHLLKFLEKNIGDPKTFKNYELQIIDEISYIAITCNEEEEQKQKKRIIKLEI